MGSQKHGVKCHCKRSTLVVGGTCDKSEGRSFGGKKNGKILEDRVLSVNICVSEVGLAFGILRMEGTFLPVLKGIRNSSLLINLITPCTL